MNSQNEIIEARIDTIESSYEYMLAFAAQGRDTDEGMTGGPSVRETLTELSEALIDLGDSVPIAKSDIATRAFAETLAADATHARRAVELVLSRSRISSQLVDNLNATIHLRSVLTDLFLIDEALKCQKTSSEEPIS